MATMGVQPSPHHGVSAPPRTRPCVIEDLKGHVPASTSEHFSGREFSGLFNRRNPERDEIHGGFGMISMMISTDFNHDFNDDF